MSRLALALVGSAALNVFVVGVVAGVAASGARITLSPPAKPKPANIWTAAQSLPPGDREKFHAMLRREADAVQPALVATRAARQQAAALMAEPAFDAAAAAAALGRARSSEEEARAEVDRGLVAYVASMPETERAELAEAMTHAGAQAVRQSVKEGDGGSDQTKTQ
jgi:uncharacterized membrane protein